MYTPIVTFQQFSCKIPGNKGNRTAITAVISLAGSIIKEQFFLSGVIVNCVCWLMISKWKWRFRQAHLRMSECPPGRVHWTVGIGRWLADKKVTTHRDWELLQSTLQRDFKISFLGTGLTIDVPRPRQICTQIFFYKTSLKVFICDII